PASLNGLSVSHLCVLNSTGGKGTPVAQSVPEAWLALGGLAGHGSQALTGAPLFDRAKRFLVLQHRVDRLQHGPSHRRAPRIATMLPRHTMVELPKLRRPLDRMHRQLNQNPA